MTEEKERLVTTIYMVTSVEAEKHIVKYGDTGVWRWSTECTRHQNTRTLASTYVLHPCKLLIQYFGGPEYKSGVKGGEGRVGCPTFKWTRSSIELLKGVWDWNST
jgi:hypothetical protein